MQHMSSKSLFSSLYSNRSFRVWDDKKSYCCGVSGGKHYVGKVRVQPDRAEGRAR